MRIANLYSYISAGGNKKARGSVVSSRIEMKFGGNVLHV